MTHEQFDSEGMYHASLSPFKQMHNEGIISDDDYGIICTILADKYQPFFVGVIVSKTVDNQRP